MKISHNPKKSLFGNDDGKLGPGVYDPKKQGNIPSFQIKGRPKDISTDKIPGPGSYEANASAVKDRLRVANFSNSPQRDTSRSISPNRDNSANGGEFYDPKMLYDSRDYNMNGHYSVKYSISKGEPKEQDNGNPGPGHYRLPSKFADVPSYSMVQSNPDFKYV